MGEGPEANDLHVPVAPAATTETVHNITGKVSSSLLHVVTGATFLTLQSWIEVFIVHYMDKSSEPPTYYTWTGNCNNFF